MKAKYEKSLRSKKTKGEPCDNEFQLFSPNTVSNCDGIQIAQAIF